MMEMKMKTATRQILMNFKKRQLLCFGSKNRQVLCYFSFLGAGYKGKTQGETKKTRANSHGYAHKQNCA